MKTILLVGEDEEETITLGITLRGSGYKVIEAQNGASALYLLRHGVQVDLVITEYHLESMTGLEVLAALRTMARRVPSIMLTRHGSVETYLRAQRLGVFEYINKPVKAQEIIRIVRAAFAEARPFEYVDYTRQQVCLC